MSLSRFVYYCAVLGGWSAFIAWMLLERPIRYLGALGDSAAAIRLWSVVAPTLTATAVGGAIGCGFGLVGETAEQWARRLRQSCFGLLGGAAGGLAGGFLGALLHTYAGLPRSLGWMIMGSAIGAAEGFARKSLRRVRNGAIGGALGGMIGGILFDLIAGPGTEMASRACAFTMLGIAIGALIGLTHVVLKRAWLTVLDGFHPGRQLILDQVATILGRGDHLPLPLLGPSAREIENEHARIIRQPDGTYVLEDRATRIGTLLNGERLTGPAVLRDGDLLRLGGNILRFNQHQRSGEPVPSPAAQRSPAALPDAPPLAPAAYPSTITPPPPPPAPPPASAPVPPLPQSPATGTLPGGAVPPHPPRMPQPPAPRPPSPGPRIPPPPPPPRNTVDR